MKRPLVIVGASVRAAAQSAIRAGFQPWLADMFADADLAACGPVRLLEPYPWALDDILRAAPDAPWMYTGALENYPALVEQLASLRPLWGNSGETLRQVRDPMRLAAALRNAGFQTPQVRTTLEAASDSGRWLRKPLHSAGGRSISIGESRVDCPKGVNFQQRIVGQPVSAVHVANGTETKLLGITTQLIGDDGSGQFWCTADWTGAKHFWYAGSIGPITQPAWLLNQATEIGQRVANEFGLVGLFGIDAILTGDALWPLEVNPRYTASIEVIERSTGIAAIEWHAQAWSEMQKAEGRRQNVAASGLVNGKVVLYATHDLQVPQSFAAWAAEINATSAWPTVSDIPHAQSAIQSGTPICTVFAGGNGLSETMLGLQQVAKSAAAKLGLRSFTATP